MYVHIFLPPLIIDSAAPCYCTHGPGKLIRTENLTFIVGSEIYAEYILNYDQDRVYVL